MKKKIFKTLLCGVSSIVLAVAGFTMSETSLEVKADETDETDEWWNEEFELRTDIVNELWVGDCEIYPQATQIYGKIKEIVGKVIEGDSVSVDYSITAIKEGYAKVEYEYWGYDNTTNADNKDLVLLGTEVYEINVINGPEVEYIGMPNSVKLGQRIGYRIDNVRYGEWAPRFCILEPNNSFSMPGYGGPAPLSRKQPGYLQTLVKKDRDGNVYESYKSYVDGYPDILAVMALYPGEYDYVLETDLGEENPEIKGTLVVEEPVIKSNEPKVIKVGESIDFKTSLENLCLEDEEVVNLFKEMYKPEITVLEGQACIEQSNKAYAELSSTEQIKFIKSGDVKIQIKYVPETDFDKYSDSVHPGYYLDGNEKTDLYTAEKIVTIKVVDEYEEETTEPTTEPTTKPAPEPTTEEVLSSELTEEEAKSIEKEAKLEGCDELTKLNVNTISKENEDFKIVSKDNSVAGKEYIVVDLKLVKDGVAVQPNGTIKIQLNVMKHLEKAKYIEVFRLDDKQKELTSLGVVPVVDGKIKFETDHFSTYVFAEASAPSQSDNPTTGDVKNILIPIGILLISTIAFGLVLYRKKHVIE